MTDRTGSGWSDARHAESVVGTWSHYFSTACMHKRCGECRRTCKFCEAFCQCSCHHTTQFDGTGCDS